MVDADCDGFRASMAPAGARFASTMGDNAIDAAAAPTAATSYGRHLAISVAALTRMTLIASAASLCFALCFVQFLLSGTSPPLPPKPDYMRTSPEIPAKPAHLQAPAWDGKADCYTQLLS